MAAQAHGWSHRGRELKCALVSLLVVAFRGRVAESTSNKHRLPMPTLGITTDTDDSGQMFGRSPPAYRERERKRERESTNGIRVNA